MVKNILRQKQDLVREKGASQNIVTPCLFLQSMILTTSDFSYSLAYETGQPSGNEASYHKGFGMILGIGAKFFAATG